MWYKSVARNERRGAIFSDCPARKNMRMISVIRFAVLLLTWLIGSVSHAQMPIQASDIQFKSIF